MKRLNAFEQQQKIKHNHFLKAGLKVSSNINKVSAVLINQLETKDHGLQRDTIGGSGEGVLAHSHNPISGNKTRVLLGP